MTTKHTTTIPVWNVTDFNNTYNETDQYGPFASVDDAKTFAGTQVSDSITLTWVAEQSDECRKPCYAAEYPGGRMRIVSAVLFLDEDAEFEAAVLHAAAEILSRNFPLITERERQALIAAAGEIKRQQAMEEAARIGAAEPVEKPPAEDYDPGPEIDDQGGMSERP